MLVTNDDQEESIFIRSEAPPPLLPSPPPNSTLQIIPAVVLIQGHLEEKSEILFGVFRK
jgi:hypothetical protein